MRCRLRAFFFLSFQNRSSGFQSGEDGKEEKEPRMIAPAFQKSCARFRCMRRMPIDDEGDRAFGILEISFPGFDERLRSPTAVCQEAQLPPALTSEITFKPSLAPVRLTAGHLGPPQCKDKLPVQRVLLRRCPVDSCRCASVSGVRASGHPDAVSPGRWPPLFAIASTFQGPVVSRPSAVYSCMQRRHQSSTVSFQ